MRTVLGQWGGGWWDGFLVSASFRTLKSCFRHISSPPKSTTSHSSGTAHDFGVAVQNSYSVPTRTALSAIRIIVTT